ncbi:hypothetical protein LRS73_18075 [Methylobacterium currus]|uniref:hypothetical protein n=1 Tax=Methylobacterium currus TaxID=2051553 RepID=UPI001E5A1D07|nr:hypothetical protein [Methylobacterium currus]UHC14456.1 hypothetical protein LRS73_18075 [Methylobacterium currus]
MRRAICTERQLMSSGLTPDLAVTALREGLKTCLASTGGYPDLIAQMDVERDRVRTLRQAIVEGIEADIAILDALAPDVRLGDGQDAGSVSFAREGGLAA